MEDNISVYLKSCEILPAEDDGWYYSFLFV